MSKQIVYISNNELQDFRALQDKIICGLSYEWEQEEVIHLHISPVLHAFGTVGKCLFTKTLDVTKAVEQGYQWLVYVNEANDVQVYDLRHQEVQQITPLFIPAKEQLYTRNKGILEIGILECKHVALIGLGSFGSQIAIELAKAGVGEFSLFDFDRVELHNLARHTCTTKDLGRLKTDAIEESILGKNPYAIVHKYPVNIIEDMEHLDTLIPNFDIVICTTDNNHSRFALSDILHKHQKICIFGRAMSRAEGGDVFVYYPDGACYNCLLGNLGAVQEEITDVTSARQTGQIPQYTSPEDADAMVQVGLSADIEPICNMMIKLTLMELSRGKESGIASLEQELVYNYYMWANRREKKYRNWAAMPGAGAKPTIMRWYGARIKQQDACVVCSTFSANDLDLGEDIEEQLNELK